MLAPVILGTVVDGTVLGAVVVLAVRAGIMVGMSGVPSSGPVGTIVRMDVGPMVSLLHTQQMGLAPIKFTLGSCLSGHEAPENNSVTSAESEIFEVHKF
jgi:hypothetical protein